MISVRTAVLTAIAMVAFAANSVLTRGALGPDLIDPASFGTVRVLAAAIMVGVLLMIQGKAPMPGRQNVFPALMLFAYVACFSFAYVSLATGTGALILFGLVQLTMFSVAILRGERFALLSWLGLAMAFGGLVYLLFPGVEAPEPLGAILMAIAGIAWGFYTLAGKNFSDPLAATGANFLLTVPLVLVVSLIFLADAQITWTGALLAIASGALASGCGYAIWYAALPGLTSGQAATAQLSAPIIAALGGVLFVGEPLGVRLVIASLLVLGGVFIVLRQRS